MKKIQPIKIWNNGNFIEAKVFDLIASNIILNNSASFNYNLYSINEEGIILQSLSSGSLIMEEEDYLKWTEDSYAWDWAAKKLNIQILP